MKVAAGMCATLALLLGAPAVQAAELTLTSPANGQSIPLVDAASGRVVYSATLVPDAVGCPGGTWSIERSAAGQGAWTAVATTAATVPALAATELRPAGDYDVRAVLRCPAAAELVSSVARIRVGDVAGQVPPVSVPLPDVPPLPGDGSAPPPPAVPVAPSGSWSPTTDETRLCLASMLDAEAARDAVRRARAAVRRRSTAKRRRALAAARSDLVAARAAQRSLC